MREPGPWPAIPVTSAAIRFTDGLVKAAEARWRETREADHREIELAFDLALCRMPPG